MRSLFIILHLLRAFYVFADAASTGWDIVSARWSRQPKHNSSAARLSRCIRLYAVLLAAVCSAEYSSAQSSRQQLSLCELFDMTTEVCSLLSDAGATAESLERAHWTRTRSAAPNGGNSALESPRRSDEAIGIHLPVSSLPAGTDISFWWRLTAGARFGGSHFGFQINRRSCNTSDYLSSIVHAPNLSRVNPQSSWRRTAISDIGRSIQSLNFCFVVNSISGSGGGGTARLDRLFIAPPQTTTTFCAAMDLPEIDCRHIRSVSSSHGHWTIHHGDGKGPRTRGGARDRRPFAGARALSSYNGDPNSDPCIAVVLNPTLPVGTRAYFSRSMFPFMRGAFTVAVNDDEAVRFQAASTGKAKWIVTHVGPELSEEPIETIKWCHRSGAWSNHSNDPAATDPVLIDALRLVPPPPTREALCRALDLSPEVDCEAIELEILQSDEPYNWFVSDYLRSPQGGATALQSGRPFKAGEESCLRLGVRLPPRTRIVFHYRMDAHPDDRILFSVDDELVAALKDPQRDKSPRWSLGYYEETAADRPQRTLSWCLSLAGTRHLQVADRAWLDRLELHTDQPRDVAEVCQILDLAEDKCELFIEAVSDSPIPWGVSGDAVDPPPTGGDQAMQSGLLPYLGGVSCLELRTAVLPRGTRIEFDGRRAVGAVGESYMQTYANGLPLDPKVEITGNGWQRYRHVSGDGVDHIYWCHEGSASQGSAERTWIDRLDIELPTEPTREELCEVLDMAEEDCGLITAVRQQRPSEISAWSAAHDPEVDSLASEVLRSGTIPPGGETCLILETDLPWQTAFRFAWRRSDLGRPNTRGRGHQLRFEINGKQLAVADSEQWSDVSLLPGAVEVLRAAGAQRIRSLRWCHRRSSLSTAKAAGWVDRLELTSLCDELLDGDCEQLLQPVNAAQDKLLFEPRYTIWNLADGEPGQGLAPPISDDFYQRSCVQLRLVRGKLLRGLSFRYRLAQTASRGEFHVSMRRSGPPGSEEDVRLVAQLSDSEGQWSDFVHRADPLLEPVTAVSLCYEGNLVNRSAVGAAIDALKLSVSPIAVDPDDDFCDLVVLGGRSSHICNYFESVASAFGRRVVFEPDSRPWRAGRVGSRRSRVLLNPLLEPGETGCMRLTISPYAISSKVSFTYAIDSPNRASSLIVFEQRKGARNRKFVARFSGVQRWRRYTHVVTDADERPLEAIGFCYRKRRAARSNQDWAAIDDIGILVTSTVPSKASLDGLSSFHALLRLDVSQPMQLHQGLWAQVVDFRGIPAQRNGDSRPMQISLSGIGVNSSSISLSISTAAGLKSSGVGRTGSSLRVENGKRARFTASAVLAAGLATATVLVEADGMGLEKASLRIPIIDFCTAVLVGGIDGDTCAALGQISADEIFEPADHPWRLRLTGGDPRLASIRNPAASNCLKLRLREPGAGGKRLTGISMNSRMFSYNDSPIAALAIYLRREGVPERQLLKTDHDNVGAIGGLISRSYAVRSLPGAPPVSAVEICSESDHDSPNRAWLELDDLELTLQAAAATPTALVLSGGEGRLLLQLDTDEPEQLRLLLRAVDSAGAAPTAAFGHAVRLQVRSMAADSGLQLSLAVDGLSMISGVAEVTTNLILHGSAGVEILLGVRLADGVRGDSVQLEAVAEGLETARRTIPVVDFCATAVAGGSDGHSCVDLRKTEVQAFFEPEELSWQAMAGGQTGDALLSSPLHFEQRVCLGLRFPGGSPIAGWKVAVAQNMALVQGNLASFYRDGEGSNWLPVNRRNLAGTAWESISRVSAQAGAAEPTLTYALRFCYGLSLYHSYCDDEGCAEGPFRIAVDEMLFALQVPFAFRLSHNFTGSELLQFGSHRAADLVGTISVFDHTGATLWAEPLDEPVRLRISADIPGTQLSLHMAGQTVTAVDTLTVPVAIHSGSAEFELAASLPAGELRGELQLQVLPVESALQELGGRMYRGEGDIVRISLLDFCLLAVSGGSDGEACAALDAAAADAVLRTATVPWQSEPTAGAPAGDDEEGRCLLLSLKTGWSLKGFSGRLFLSPGGSSADGEGADPVFRLLSAGQAPETQRWSRLPIAGAGWQDFSQAVAELEWQPVSTVGLCYGNFYDPYVGSLAPAADELRFEFDRVPPLALYVDEMTRLTVTGHPVEFALDLGLGAAAGATTLRITAARPGTRLSLYPAAAENGERHSGIDVLAISLNAIPSTATELVLRVLVPDGAELTTVTVAVSGPVGGVSTVVEIDTVPDSTTITSTVVPATSSTVKACIPMGGDSVVVEIDSDSNTVPDSTATSTAVPATSGTVKVSSSMDGDSAVVEIDSDSNTVPDSTATSTAVQATSGTVKVSSSMGGDGVVADSDTVPDSTATSTAVPDSTATSTAVPATSGTVKVSSSMDGDGVVADSDSNTVPDSTATSTAVPATSGTVEVGSSMGGDGVVTDSDSNTVPDSTATSTAVPATSGTVKACVPMGGDSAVVEIDSDSNTVPDSMTTTSTVVPADMPPTVRRLTVIDICAVAVAGDNDGFNCRQLANIVAAIRTEPADRPWQVMPGGVRGNALFSPVLQDGGESCLVFELTAAVRVLQYHALFTGGSGDADVRIRKHPTRSADGMRGAVITTAELRREWGAYGWKNIAQQSSSTASQTLRICYGLSAPCSGELCPQGRGGFDELELQPLGPASFGFLPGIRDQVMLQLGSQRPARLQKTLQAFDDGRRRPWVGAISEPVLLQLRSLIADTQLNLRPLENAGKAVVGVDALATTLTLRFGTARFDAAALLPADAFRGEMEFVLTPPSAESLGRHPNTVINGDRLRFSVVDFCAAAVAGGRNGRGCTELAAAVDEVFFTPAEYPWYALAELADTELALYAVGNPDAFDRPGRRLHQNQSSCLMLQVATDQRLGGFSGRSRIDTNRVLAVYAHRSGTSKRQLLDRLSEPKGSWSDFSYSLIELPDGPISAISFCMEGGADSDLFGSDTVGVADLAWHFLPLPIKLVAGLTPVEWLLPGGTAEFELDLSAVDSSGTHYSTLLAERVQLRITAASTDTILTLLSGDQNGGQIVGRHSLTVDWSVPTLASAVGRLRVQPAAELASSTITIEVIPSGGVPDYIQGSSRQFVVADFCTYAVAGGRSGRNCAQLTAAVAKVLSTPGAWQPRSADDDVGSVLRSWEPVSDGRACLQFQFATGRERIEAVELQYRVYSAATTARVSLHLLPADGARIPFFSLLSNDINAVWRQGSYRSPPTGAEPIRAAEFCFDGGAATGFAELRDIAIRFAELVPAVQVTEHRLSPQLGTARPARLQLTVGEVRDQYGQPWPESLVVALPIRLRADTAGTLLKLNADAAGAASFAGVDTVTATVYFQAGRGARLEVVATLPAGAESSTLAVWFGPFGKGIRSEPMIFHPYDLCTVIIADDGDGSACASIDAAFEPADKPWRLTAGEIGQGAALRSAEIGDGAHSCLVLRAAEGSLLYDFSLRWRISSQRAESRVSDEGVFSEIAGDLFSLGLVLLGSDDLHNLTAGPDSAVGMQQPYSGEVAWRIFHYHVSSERDLLAAIHLCYVKSNTGTAGEDLLAVDELDLLLLPQQPVELALSAATGGQLLQVHPDHPVQTSLTVRVLDRLGHIPELPLQAPLLLRIVASDEDTELSLQLPANGGTVGGVGELTATLTIGPAAVAELSLAVTLGNAADFASVNVLVSTSSLADNGVKPASMDILVGNFCSAVVAGGKSGDGCRLLSVLVAAVRFVPPDLPWQLDGTENDAFLHSPQLDRGERSCLQLEFVANRSPGGFSLRYHLGDRENSPLFSIEPAPEDSTDGQWPRLNFSTGDWSEYSYARTWRQDSLAFCYRGGDGAEAVVAPVRIDDILLHPPKFYALRPVGGEQLLFFGDSARFELEAVIVDTTSVLSVATEERSVHIGLRVGLMDEAMLSLHRQQLADTMVSGVGEVVYPLRFQATTEKLIATVSPLANAPPLLHLTASLSSAPGALPTAPVSRKLELIDVCELAVAGGRSGKACEIISAVTEQLLFVPPERSWQVMMTENSGELAWHSPAGLEAAEQSCLHWHLRTAGQPIAGFSLRYRLSAQPGDYFSISMVRAGDLQPVELARFSEEQDWQAFRHAVTDPLRQPVSAMVFCYRRDPLGEPLDGEVLDQVAIADLQLMVPAGLVLQAPRWVLWPAAPAAAAVAVELLVVDASGEPLPPIGGGDKRLLKVRVDSSDRPLILNTFAEITRAASGRGSVEDHFTHDIFATRKLAVEVEPGEELITTLQVEAAAEGLRSATWQVGVVDFCALAVIGGRSGDPCRELATGFAQLALSMQAAFEPLTEGAPESDLGLSLAAANDGDSSCLRFESARGYTPSRIEFRYRTNVDAAVSTDVDVAVSTDGDVALSVVLRRGEGPHQRLEVIGTGLWSNFIHAVATTDTAAAITAIDLCNEAADGSSLMLDDFAFEFAATSVPAPPEQSLVLDLPAGPQRTAIAGQAAVFTLQLGLQDAAGKRLQQVVAGPVQITVTAESEEPVMLRLHPRGVAAADGFSGVGSVNGGWNIAASGVAELVLEVVHTGNFDSLELSVSAGAEGLQEVSQQLLLLDFCALAIAGGRQGQTCRNLIAANARPVFEPAAKPWLVPLTKGGDIWALWSPSDIENDQLCLRLNFARGANPSRLSMQYLLAPDAAEEFVVELRRSGLGLKEQISVPASSSASWSVFDYSLPQLRQQRIEALAFCLRSVDNSDAQQIQTGQLQLRNIAVEFESLDMTGEGQVEVNELVLGMRWQQLCRQAQRDGVECELDRELFTRLLQQLGLSVEGAYRIEEQRALNIMRAMAGPSASDQYDLDGDGVSDQLDLRTLIRYMAGLRGESLGSDLDLDEDALRLLMGLPVSELRLRP